MKAVGPNPAEKPKHYVAHTPERALNIVHSTDGEKLQEHCDRAMKGEEHWSRPSHHHHQHKPHIYQSFDPCPPYYRDVFSDLPLWVNPTLSKHTSTNAILTNPATPTNPSHLTLTDTMLPMFYLCQSTLTSHGSPIPHHLSCTTHGHGQRTRGTLLTQIQCPMVMDSNTLPTL